MMRIFGELQRWRLSCIVVVSIGFAALQCGCGNSFKAEGGSASAPKVPEKVDDAGGAGTDPAFQQRPEESTSTTSAQGGTNTGIDSSNSTVCSNGEVNIVLVFDNSGSQSSSDLQSMRSGAAGLLSELSALASQINSPFIPFVSVVRFSDSATIGANRWVNMKTNSGGATTDVNAATADDGGNTHYAQALARVGDLFREKQASISKKNQRNFVVFLSDGEPDDDSAVRSAAQSVTDQAGAVHITVGTGGKKFTILKEMSGIVSANLPPNHRGQFFEASGQAALSATFRQVGDNLKALCK